MSLQEIHLYLQQFHTVSCIVRLLVAALLGGIIGYEREQYGRPAGLRTHILVCIGATATVVAGLYAALVLGFSNDPLRTSAQVISGIGFLGAGTIFMRKDNHVVGLTTAAGLWTTAAIGIIVGLGFFPFAFVMTGVEILAMVLLGKWEIARQERRKARKLYLEIEGVEHLQSMIDFVGRHRVEILHARSGLQGHIGLSVTMLPRQAEELAEPLIEQLQQRAGVVCVLQEKD